MTGVFQEGWKIEKKIVWVFPNNLVLVL